MKIIDAHQHFWKLERGDYSWLTEDMGILYQNYLPEDLEPILKKESVAGTVLVQAAPTLDETMYLLSLYEKYPWIYGVVGWLDLSSTDFPEQLDSLTKFDGVVGFRPMLQDIEQHDWILQDQVIENLKLLIKYDLPLDLLINKNHIPYILTLLKALPDLRAVVDHLAKPNVSNKKEFQKWKEDMEELAKFSNVSCKLSGLMTQVEGSWEIDDFNPYIHHVVSTFGQKRVMFGSDWPVSLLGGTYKDAIAIIKENLPDSITEQEREFIFSKNAKSFYKLTERRGENGER